MKNEYHVVHLSSFYPKIWYPIPKKELNLRAVNFILGILAAIVQNNRNTNKKITTKLSNPIFTVIVENLKECLTFPSLKCKYFKDI